MKNYGGPTPRTLIHVSIAHTPEDMGSLGKNLPADDVYLRQARDLWAEIERRVQALELDWRRVKVYQDGLPDAGVDIVHKILAEVQSHNYDVLRWLVAQGAEVIGSESPALMKEEYHYLLAVHSTKDDTARAKARRSYAKRAPMLLAERDAYIAQRITATLPEGGTGLLFIGQAHAVPSHLPPDIAVGELLAERPRRSSK